MDVPERILAGGPWAGVTLVQVTLVAALGLAVWLAVRPGAPALRGAVVLAALVGLLVVPGLATVAPVWLPLPEIDRPAAGLEPPEPVDAVPVPPPPAERPVVTAVAPAEPPGKMPTGPDDLIDPFDELDPLENPEPVVAAPPPAEEAAAPVRPAEAPRPPRPVAEVLMAVWLLGALAYLARALVCLALLYYWVWRARPISEGEWAACLTSPPDRDSQPRIAVRENPAVDSPLTLGLFRPVILLPASWRGWPAEQLRLVLAHELAHVRRRDFLAGLVAELAVCLCWFHPLVRWLAGRLRLEQEYVADARAAAGDAVNYVRCLARLALEQGTGRGSPAPAFWRRRPEILRRIDMLRRNRDGLAPRLGRGTTCVVVLLAAIACVAVAGVGPLRAIADFPAPADPAPAPADPVEAKAPATAVADVYGDPLPAGALARLGTTRWRHGSAINYLGFGPDGKTLVTAGQDGTVRLWDLATGKEVRRFARPIPSGVRPGPAPLRPPGFGGGTGAVPVSPVPIPPAVPAAAEAAAAKAKRELAEVEAAVAAAKSKLDAAKAGADADAIKLKIDAAKAKADALKAELEAQAQVRQRLVGNAGGSLGVALTDDGKTLAVAGGNVIQLYEVATGDELRKIDGPPTGLVGLLFSPDGKTLAGRAPDGGVILWDAETGKERHRIKAPGRPNDPKTQAIVLRGGGGDTPGMAFTPDSAALAVATAEFKEQSVTGRVVLWDVASGEQGREVKAVEGMAVSAVAFAPGGKALAYCANGVVHACDVKTGSPLYENRLAEPAVGLLFSPDGKTLAVRGRSQQVRVCDAANGKELYVLGDPVSPVRGGAVAVALARPLSFSPETRNVAFSPDGRQIATAADGTVRLWAAATGKELPLSDSHHGPLAAVVISSDGETVISWGADRMIRRWEAATGKPLGGFRLPPGAAALSPDGRTVAVAGQDGMIRLHETANGKEVLQFKGHQRGSAALVFSPDGKALAERGADGAIRLYDPAKGTELRQFAAQAASNPYPPGVVVAVPARVGFAGTPGLVFSPDGKLLASAGSSPGVVALPGAAVGRGRPNGGASINLFDLGTGKVIRKIEPTLPVSSFAFSPDGRVLATENADESVSLWEVASGKERARLGKAAVAAAPPLPGATARLVKVVGGGVGFAEPAGPTTLAFSPDGRVLVARGPDRSASAWDVTGGQEVGQLKGHDGRVETVSFSPDGKTVASGSTDTTVLLWDAVALRKDLPAPQSAELPDGAAESLWADLAGEDAGKARQGVFKLAGDPRQAVPFLAERLKPAAPIDPQKLERWVADLESDRFAVRQEAAASLVKAGEQVVPALQKVLTTQPTIETRLRVEGLLDKLTGGALTTEQLRLVRAVEVLERMGTPDAREVLRTLAGGASGAFPTREAQAALDRLSGR
jgi:WD40 repeat protein/beta-lactamase regulating signal transducer with metallopeptidase domain